MLFCPQYKERLGSEAGEFMFFFCSAYCYVLLFSLMKMYHVFSTLYLKALFYHKITEQNKALFEDKPLVLHFGSPAKDAM